MENLKIKVVVTPTTSKLVGRLNRDVIDQIDSVCSYIPSGAEYTNKVREMLWDGVTHLFSLKTYSFPTGLLDKVVNVLKNFNIEYQIEHNYPPLKTIQLKQDVNITFRDYQQEALNMCKLYERGIIKIPTAGGKTSIYSGLICQKQVPTFVFVHRKELLYQTQKRLYQDAGLKVGIVGDGKVEFNDVSVGMMQTLVNMIKNNEHLHELQKYNMIISDECHILGAKTFYKVCKKFVNAVYRYGGSATPLYREDGNILIEAALGPIIYSKNISDLKQKHIADVKVFFIYFKQEPKYKYLSYKDVYDQAVVHNWSRNKIAFDIVQKFQGKRILIFVKTIQHGQILENLIPGAVFVHGSKKSKERVKILEGLNKGTIKTVISTSIWEQGIDIPSLEIIVDMRAEKSKIAYIQLIGRALRKTDTKTKALVFDIYDKGCRWISNHAKERLEIINEEFKESYLIQRL